MINNNVDHPKHYNEGLEAIDVIESWDLNFNVGNVIKYMSKFKTLRRLNGIWTVI